MFKRIIITVLILAVMVSMVACSNSQVVEQPGGDLHKGVPVSVTDHLGRTVNMDKVPERIVSAYYISTSVFMALGMGEKLIGIEAKADTRPIYFLAAPELIKLPNVGTAKNFDLEACMALKPDLVILPVKLKDQIETLEKMGITVIGVNPENHKLLGEMITMIAKLTGAKGHEELLQYYSQKEKELQEIRGKAKAQPKVYLAGNSSLLSTASKKMYQNDMIEAAGGTNVAADIEETYWANISYEKLNAYDPEYIIIAPEAVYTTGDVLNDNNISGISAVRNKQVYKMPDRFEAWDSPIPSAILGKLWLASTLHESEYPYEKFVDEASYFYEKFYNIKIDNKALIRNDTP